MHQALVSIGRALAHTPRQSNNRIDAKKEERKKKTTAKILNGKKHNVKCEKRNKKNETQDERMLKAKEFFISAREFRFREPTRLKPTTKMRK